MIVVSTPVVVLVFHRTWPAPSVPAVPAPTVQRVGTFAQHYFHHANDYWQYTVGDCPSATNASVKLPVVDLWEGVMGGGEGQCSTPAHQCNTPSNPRTGRVFLVASAGCCAAPAEAPPAWGGGAAAQTGSG